jgi:PAS domain S-box-containing protein
MPAMPASRPESEPFNIQLLVDSIPALIHTSRPDGYLDYFNKPWLEFLGVTLDKMAGWNWTAYIHPEDLDGIVARWRACLASGEIFEYEARVRRANGEYRWMFHRKVPLRDERGNIVKWYGSSLDIEERKTTEEQLRRNTYALQRSEFYLAEGQRLAHMGSWAFDPDGFYYWSPELFRMHGLDPAGKPPSIQEYLNCVHPQDRESMADVIQGILAEVSPFDATKRIVRPNGDVRYIRCVGAPVVENQKLKKYVGSAIDVTEHELLTLELRRREAYLAEAQKLSQTGSWAWNPATGEPGYWSAECYRVLGFDPAEPLPLLETIFQRIQPAAVREQFERGIHDKADFELEMSYLHPTKGIRNILSTGHAVVDTHGDLREAVGTVGDITERKRAEEAIRRSEAYLAEAQRLSHTGSWAWNVHTGALFWSQEIFRIYGYEPQETGPTWEQFLQRVHPDDRAQIEQRAKIETARNEWADSLGDFRIVLPGGTIKHLHSVAHPARDASGEITEIIGTVMDVTEHELLTQELRRREAYLAGAQRLSHTGSFGWKPDTGEIVWSEESYRIFEYDRSIIPTIASLVQRVHPEDRADVKEVVNRAIAGAPEFEHAYRLLLPDGRVKHVHAIAPVLRDGSGNREFIGAVTDITERKVAEEKIREQEAELRQIVDLLPQLIAVYGPNRERFYANRTALEYLSISLDEWRHETFGHSTHPDDSERLKTAADRAFSSGSAYEVELRLRKHDGTYRWFLARYNPVRDDKGQIARWYVTATDIEDRKQAEDRLRQENVALREEIDKTSMFEEIVGTSPALRAVLSRVSKVAPTDSTVLITGETGTGKELVARAIHRRSRRSTRAFVSVNCAAIPRDLIASELFGHEKGAFTGALQRRVGRFELAEAGTIFLDEVGELPTETQIALLRVLQEREFDRVGGSRPIRADVRVIAATNRDLEAAVNAGSFRSDLFYRLNVFPIEIPSLRERRVDIPLLVEYFVDRYARKAGKNIERVSKRTLELLQSYPWPGNIRELQNVIERSVILCETEIFSIDENWLPHHPPPTLESKQQAELPQSLLVQEKNMIEAALKDTHGRVSGPTGAAIKLGIPRSTLESKIRSLKINKNSFRPMPGAY